MERTSGAGDAGVVDQNIEPVEGAVDPLGERFNGSEIGDIAFDNGRLRGISFRRISFPALLPPAFAPPVLCIAAAVCSSAARERPQRKVWAPSSASVIAMARPMPRPAPVMTATWPVSGEVPWLVVYDAMFVKTFGSGQWTSALIRLGRLFYFPSFCIIKNRSEEICGS